MSFSYHLLAFFFEESSARSFGNNMQQENFLSLILLMFLTEASKKGSKHTLVQDCNKVGPTFYLFWPSHTRFYVGILRVELFGFSFYNGTWFAFCDKLTNSNVLRNQNSFLSNFVWKLVSKGISIKTSSNMQKIDHH